MEMHECVLEPLCRTCTIGSTIGVILLILAGITVVGGIVECVRNYFKNFEQRIARLEETCIKKKN